MIRVPIHFATKTHEALIGIGLIDDAGAIIAEKIRPTRCAIVTDETIGPLFAASLQQSLTKSGFRPILISIPSGEQFKVLEQVGRICERMTAAGLDRESFIVGLGGGVIGDISGFSAAIFHRGVPHVQIPTTLLAMVDSSIGGKTGVNTASGKNLIGAIHQPLLVIDDVAALRTLPDRDFNQGFAEIVKHGIIADSKMFEMLCSTPASTFRPDASNGENLAKLIRRNIEIKSGIAAKDEHDRAGDRAILNFGHTVGHGIERAGNYQRFMHGEAISLGMVAASSVSMKRAGLPRGQQDAIVNVLSHFNLPTRLPPEFPRDAILEAVKFDKKFQDGQIRYVVTPRIGTAYLAKDVTLEDIREAVEAL